MAKWKERNQALPLLVIIGRMAGFDDGLLFKENNDPDYSRLVDSFVEEINKKAK